MDRNGIERINDMLKYEMCSSTIIEMIYRKLKAFNMHTDKMWGWRIARKINTPPQILAELYELNDEDINNALVLNPNTPPDILSKLYKSRDDIVKKIDLARNPNTPPEILTKLYELGDKRINNKLASNPNTPPAILTKLFEKKDDVINIKLLFNLNIDSRILEHILNGLSFEQLKHYITYSNLSQHISPHLLEYFVDNKEQLCQGQKAEDIFSIYFCIAEDKRVKPDTLREIAEEILKGSNRIKQFKVSKSVYKEQDIVRELLKNPNTPPEIIGKFAELLLSQPIVERNAELYIALAANPQTSPDVLKELSEKAFTNVYFELASNPSTPKEVLRNIAERISGNEDLVVRLVLNPNTPDAIIAKKYVTVLRSHRVCYKLAEDPKTLPDKLEELKTRFIREEDDNGIIALIKNPNIEETGILEELSKIIEERIKPSRTTISPERYADVMDGQEIKSLHGNTPTQIDK